MDPVLLSVNQSEREKVKREYLALCEKYKVEKVPYITIRKKHGSLRYQIEKNFGLFTVFFKELGLPYLKTTTQRKRGNKSLRIWKNFKKEIKEVADELGYFPSSTELAKLERHDLINTARKHHGSYRAVRRKLDPNYVDFKDDKTFWRVTNNMKRLYGNVYVTGNPAGQKYYREIKKRFGSVTAFREYLKISSKNRRALPKTLQELETLLTPIVTSYKEKFGEPPSYTFFSSMHSSHVRHSIEKFGGWIKVKGLLRYESNQSGFNDKSKTKKLTKKEVYERLDDIINKLWYSKTILYGSRTDIKKDDLKGILYVHIEEQFKTKETLSMSITTFVNWITSETWKKYRGMSESERKLFSASIKYVQRFGFVRGINEAAEDLGILGSDIQAVLNKGFGKDLSLDKKIRDRKATLGDIISKVS